MPRTRSYPRSEQPSLPSSTETSKITKSLSLRARTESCGDVGERAEWDRRGGGGGGRERGERRGAGEASRRRAQRSARRALGGGRRSRIPNWSSVRSGGGSRRSTSCGS